MRTVICHFFNEEFLLPWWLRHHALLFDHGILIDHGSTDRSVEICREIVPDWQLVRSKLSNFDARLTDFEVMQYEYQTTGWKIALNVTEFLVPTIELWKIENALTKHELEGCGASGIGIVDHFRREPVFNQSLVSQYWHGYMDNKYQDIAIRSKMGLTAKPARNRLYHCSPIGSYAPGRHTSYHPNHSYRCEELMVFHFGFAPWTQLMLRRKLQIAEKVPSSDLKYGWGIDHLIDEDKLEVQYQQMCKWTYDLRAYDSFSSGQKFMATKFGHKGT
jgi:hypothetical protein